jgi:hypothetical protein
MVCSKNINARNSPHEEVENAFPISVVWFICSKLIVLQEATPPDHVLINAINYYLHLKIGVSLLSRYGCISHFSWRYICI